MEMKLFETLKDAYETTTHNFNAFAVAVKAVAWDNTFEADGEHYFVKGAFTLTAESLNPFEEAWPPTAFFSNNSIVEF